MSANLDLVRSIYADWERGDFSSWAYRRADPEIEYVSVGGSEPGTFRGLTELGKTWRGRISAWEDARVKAEGYRVLDDERVLVFFSLTGRGRTSGLDLGELHRQYVAVFHISDGTVTRLVIDWDRDHALADLGLEEQAKSKESTTPDLVGAIRASVEAVNRRDWDAVESFYAPDAVNVGVEALGTFEGATAIRGYYEDLARAVDDFHVETQEIIDLGNGVTFAVVLVTGHPVGSSAEVRIRYGSVASWTEAVIERLTAFMDIDEGRAAAERLAEERG